MVKRRIAVVTGSRAEYGLLYWLLKTLRDAENVELQILITGMHLSPFFGKTIDLIKADGFSIAAEVDLLVDGDTPRAVAKSVGLGVIGFTDALTTLKPDIVVGLGDRFELLAAVQAAFFLKIPVAHIHGGEVTTGALDDAVRHAITKFSSLHFVAAEIYKQRVIQMGELPHRIFNVGAPGLENIAKLSLDDRYALENRLNFKMAKQNFLIVYHPATMANEDPIETIDLLFKVLLRFPETHFIVTGSNADDAGRSICARLIEIQKELSSRMYFSITLGQEAFLSALKLCDLIVGNSSCGIIEAPSMGTPTVNLGARQEGRIRSPSIIDCKLDEDSIYYTIKKALSSSFQEIVKRCESPYAQKGFFVAENIAEILKTYNLELLKQKPFYDIHQFSNELEGTCS